MDHKEHRYLNSVPATALFIPFGFFLIRDIIATITGFMFKIIGGEPSFLYQINDDLARLVISVLLLIVMRMFFRGSCSFGLKGKNAGLGILLALPVLIAPVWNILQIMVYHAPLVTGTAAVATAVLHGIGPGVSEEIFCRGFVISNLMRIEKDNKDRILRCMVIS